MILPTLLLPLCLAASAPPDEWISMHLPNISNVILLPDNEVFLFHTDGSTTWLPGLENLRFEGWHASGPIVASSINVVLGPHQLETEYTDKNGFTHRIITKCGNMKPEPCAKKHYAQVCAVVKFFPFSVGNK